MASGKTGTQTPGLAAVLWLPGRGDNETVRILSHIAARGVANTLNKQTDRGDCLPTSDPGSSPVLPSVCLWRQGEARTAWKQGARWLLQNLWLYQLVVITVMQNVWQFWKLKLCCCSAHFSRLWIWLFITKVNQEVNRLYLIRRHVCCFLLVTPFHLLCQVS